MRGGREMEVERARERTRKRNGGGIEMKAHWIYVLLGNWKVWVVLPENFVIFLQFSFYIHISHTHAPYISNIRELHITFVEISWAKLIRRSFPLLWAGIRTWVKNLTCFYNRPKSPYYFDGAWKFMLEFLSVSFSALDSAPLEPICSLLLCYSYPLTMANVCLTFSKDKNRGVWEKKRNYENLDSRRRT